MWWKWLSETRSRGGARRAAQFFFWKRTETWNFGFLARKPTPPAQGPIVQSHDQDAADLRPAAWPGLRLRKLGPGPGVSADWWKSGQCLQFEERALNFERYRSSNQKNFVRITNKEKNWCIFSNENFVKTKCGTKEKKSIENKWTGLFCLFSVNGLG